MQAHNLPVSFQFPLRLVNGGHMVLTLRTIATQSCMHWEGPSCSSVHLLANCMNAMWIQHLTVFQILTAPIEAALGIFFAWHPSETRIVRLTMLGLSGRKRINGRTGPRSLFPPF